MFELKKTVSGIALERDGVVAVQANASAEGSVLLNRCAFEGLDGKLHAPWPGKQAFKDAVDRALRTARIKDRLVSLSLPDTLAKTVILDFEELPDSSIDAFKVVQMKLARSLYLDPGDFSIDYHVLSTYDGVKVLAMLVKRKLLKDYEDALIELGLRVERISIHSLNMLNMLALIHDAVASAGNFAFVMSMKGYFSVLVFSGGVMDFFRSKEIADEGALIKELGSSFVYYSGTHYNVALEKVFVVGATGTLAETIEALADAKVELVSPDDLIISRRAVDLDINVDFEGVDKAALLAAIGAAAGF